MFQLRQLSTPANRKVDPRVRRWRQGRFAILALGGLLTLTIVMTQFGLVGRAGDDWAQFDRQTARVVGIVDSQTCIVRPAGGSEQRVRLIGLDAPGSTPSSQHWAAESKLALAGRIDGRDVVLWLEPTHTRADDGSLLAHVYLPDGEHVNVELIRAGSAYADRRTPHSMAQHFEQAENEARGKRRGLWADVTEAQMPPWRQAWLQRLRVRNAERGIKPTTRPGR